MRATVMFGAGDVRVEDRPEPVLKAPTDAIVRVVRACVCGSDLHPYHSMAPNSAGQPMGHEFVGVVEDTGSAVTSVRRGDFVISPFAWSDNTCDVCRDGFQTACRRGGFFSGGQAEFVRVPQADGTLVATPATKDEGLLASLLALSDVYLTGYHAAHLGKVGPGKNVTVIGDGAVGLSAVLAARQLGAEQIILMGRHTARTELGREFGASDVVAQRGPEGIAAVLELTGGAGTHVVIEAVGHMPAYEQSVAVVRAGGVISRVGVPQYDQAPVGFTSLFGRNITLTGGPAPVRAYLDATIPQVLAGTINPGRVFDRTVPLEQAPQAYAAMEARDALKVMLVP